MPCLPESAKRHGDPVRALLAWTLLLLAPGLRAHDGPDPVWDWSFDSDHLGQGQVTARLGPSARIEGELELVVDEHGESLYFHGRPDRAIVATDLHELRASLPSRHFTVSAWVSVNQPQPWGGILGVLQDNGNAEKGWIVGYDERVFSFGLASAGADDGDGAMTYMKGTTPYEAGKLHHVVATYDGAHMRLYVDGQLDAETDEQTGDLLYPDAAPVVLAGYSDENEDYFHVGRLRRVMLFDLAAEPEWVEDRYEHDRALSALAAWEWIDPEHRLVMGPLLQWATQDGMTIVWETSRPSSSVVEFGTAALPDPVSEEFVVLPQRVDGQADVRIHQVRVAGLEPGTAYMYRISSTDDLGRELTSDMLTFQTAPPPGRPIAFAVISDTQDNPTVSRIIADHAWEQRPHFVLHPGDLVGTGRNLDDWTGEFFPSMGSLLARVPLFPVLGNHEQDARFYYDYMALPEPEYYYEFQYGDAHVFVIDTNREVGPGSEQYAWLERRLAASDASWKFVSYHHPSYTSDENDYGNMWRGTSSHGDLRVRKLVPLYDRYGVDIVFNGHIHSYERTWPLRKEDVVDEGGTVYMITGGGGGSLETPGPTRPWFANTVRRGHHYCMVRVNGRVLELKAYDVEGRLFDTLELRKD